MKVCGFRTTIWFGGYFADVSLIMKPTATTLSGSHPADRILAIVQGLQEEIATLKQTIQTMSQGRQPAGEATRIQAQIDDINKKLADPLLELSAEIRLTRERAELEAYLKGLRFSISPD
jgi:hypothetical protein